MRKIVIAISLLLGLANAQAQAQAEFSVNGKKVSTCNVATNELKVKVPVPAELNNYKHAALVIKVYKLDGDNPDDYSVFKKHLSKEDRESGFAEGVIIKKDGSSEFGSGLATWEGEVMFRSPFSEINMRDWNADPGRLYSKIRIEVRIDKGVPTKTWDADHGVYYTDFPYESVKSFSGNCEVVFDEPSKEFKGASVPVSLTNQIDGGKVDLYNFDKREVKYDDKTFWVNRSIYYIQQGEKAKVAKHTYEFVTLNKADIDLETLKSDLNSYLYYRANKESKSSSPLDAFGSFGKKLGGKKEGKSSEKPVPAKMKWTSLLNDGINIVLPGLFTEDTKIEAAAGLKTKSPEVPLWTQEQLGGKQVWVLAGTGVYQSGTLDGTEHLCYISVFAVELGDKIVLGFFSADGNTRSKHDTNFSKSLLEDINKTLKFL